MKISPAARYDQHLGVDNKRARGFMDTLFTRITEDADARTEWLERKRHYYRRRYAMEYRQPSFPWPGASELVMPLIDMNIDRMKPMFVNLVAAVHPPVTVLGATAEHMRKAATIELFFDWMIRAGSPGFIKEVIYGVDDMLECGRMILKTFWRYETRQAPETLSYKTMPQALRRFIVVKNKRYVQQFELLTGQQLMTDGVFSRFKEEIKKAIALEMDMDPEESRDAQAIDKVMAWLKAGAAEPITIEKRDTIVNAPAIAAVNPAHLIVPPHTTSVENAEHLTHEMQMTATQIRQRAKDNGWDKAAVKRLLESGGMDTPIRRRRWQDDDQEESLREGTTQDESYLYTIRESCAWYADAEYGQDKKVVLTWSPDLDLKLPLKFCAYQRPSGRWPYHTSEFESNKRRWYSPRGIPEKLQDLDWEITQQHRAKLNRMTIANSPTFMYRMHRNVNPQNFRWIPGQMMPVTDITDVAPMQVPNLDMSFEREEQVLRTWAEQYLGATDFGLSNPLSSLTEPRTKYEIQSIQAASRQSLSLRGLVFQQMMQEVYDEFFDMWHTWGPDEVYVRVTGEEPISISKEDLQGDYLFLCTGTIGEEDPALEAQKALGRIQVLSELSQNPQAMGPEWEINMGEAVLDWMEKDDIRASRRILRRRSPQEIQALQQEAEKQSAVQGFLTGQGAEQQNSGQKKAKPSPQLLGRSA